MNGTSGQSIALITVQDDQGVILSTAQVELRPATAAAGTARVGLPYDRASGLYVSPPVELGDYLLLVRAPGFLEQEVQVEIRRPDHYETIALGRPGMPYFVRAGRRVYFTPDGQKIAALVREPAAPPETVVGERLAAASEAYSRLLALEVESPIAAPGFKIFDPTRPPALGPAPDLARELEQAPEVLDAGPLLRSAVHPRFLSSLIEVETAVGVSAADLAQQVAPLGLKIHYRDGHDPQLFLLKSTRLPDPAFGALPERLRALPGIRSAQSLITAPETTTQPFIPTDPDAALQFHHYLTFMPEAWHHINAANNAQSFGSADVIVAVHDEGILTTGAGTVITHPEFSGTVTGGSLSTQPGLNSNKVLLTFDFRNSPMRPGNDAAGTHGSWVAGTISAASNGLAGTVGGAANTRLCSYRRPTTSGTQWAHDFDFMAGMDPRWQQGGIYTAAEPFPNILGTGRQPVPGADIINASHTHFAAVNAAMRNTLLRISLFGRRRRGTMVFAAAGNQDQDARIDGTWGEDTNVMRVAASALDLRLEEVRMNYSSFALIGNRVVDFAAPSESQNVNPTVHQVPRMFGFITTDLNTTSGNLQTTAALRAPLTNSPAAGTRGVQVSAANFASFSVGDNVIVRNPNTPLFSELHTIAALVPATNTLTLNRDLGYSFSAGSAEIIRLGGTTAYSTQFGGTSAAVPQASAIAALMLSVNPALSWLEVRELMRRTATAIHPRYRGSIYATAPNFRYRWLDTSVTPPVDLIDGNGLLTITGGNTTISIGPVTRGDRLLFLDNLAGIQARQALVIGAETKLNGAHPRPAPNQNVINVDRTNEFDLGDTVFIGKNSQTVLINAAAVGDTVIWVQSVDGFVTGDDITLTGASSETVRITGIARMTNPPTAGQPANFGAADTGFNITRLNAAGNPIAGGLSNAYARADLVAIANTQFEGPFTVNGKNATSLTLNNPVVRTHPDDRVVRKQGTEVKAVVRVMGGNVIEVDPLDFDHPFNAGGVEHVRIGRVAGYSLGFGFGRLDAAEAVQAAQSYTHDERDLLIRSFLADDGVTHRDAQEVASPDIWVRNDAATTLATLPNWNDPGPHQAPEVTVDPAIFLGSGRNDLEVSGACTSATEVTFTIEIDAAAATDTFKWRKDSGATTNGVAITGAAQVLSDGVSIRFAATTGHTLGDKWQVKARQVNNRFLHVRSFNRGTLPTFTTSAFGGAPLDVARSRLLLCMSDGFPVCRFASVAAAPGNNDLEVVAAYTGANPRALYTVEITAVAAGGDTFRWHRDGAPQPPVTLTPATLTQVLNDGVQVRFGAISGHAVGDRWDIYARAGADAFLNLDHAWEFDEPTPFALTAADQAGTRMMAENGISGLAATTAVIHSTTWGEALRPPTNSPNLPKPTRPLRLFALGEAVPHDGKLNGFTAKTNNNFSFRELSFAKLRLTQDDALSALDNHLEVDALGTVVAKNFRVEVRTMTLSFTVERVEVQLTARKTGAVEEVQTFKFTAGAWSMAPAALAWATLNPPREARRPDGTDPVAAGEQFDVNFSGTYRVDKSFTQLEIKVRLLSNFRDHAVAEVAHTVNVYEVQPLPQGVGLAQSATVPKPASFAFADMASLTQNASQAFGPVHDPADANSRQNRFRTTSLFRSLSAVKAYAVVDSLVLLQRDPANNDTVNLVLQPLVQPVAGFTPVRYFIYRGLRLSDFLAGSSGADAKKIRAKAGASPFLTGVWTVFEGLNPGVTEMPSTVLGYDPDQQTGTDKLDALFFQVGGAQLPVVLKGAELGSFHHNAGNRDFGCEIVLEEGGYEPDLAFARLAEHVIDITGLPTATGAQRFARTIRQEEILNFMDPAAFYGLHLHEGGKVEVAGTANPLTGLDVFDQVVSKFFTRHQLYFDVRSENGSSLNFYGNYDDGNGNQVQVGPDPATLVPRSYATHGWPLLILDMSTPVATGESYNTVGLRLRINDNERGVVYIDHGQLLTPASRGAFVRGTELHSGTAPWTDQMGFRFPNTGPSGARPGVAWVLRLVYGRLANPTPTVPVPASVLKTEHYTDNAFGPIDRAGRWAGTPGILWFTTQDQRYVDAQSALGWKQMVECGIAFQTATTSRVLLYASLTASDTHDALEFVPLRGITDGASSKNSFFAAPGLFANYLLEFDQIADGATTVRTFKLLQHPTNGFPPSNVLLLGLERAQFDALQAMLANGISPDYLRNLKLVDKSSQVDANGKSFDRYRVGIQGLKTADGEFATEFPAVDIQVYTVDGQFFFSKLFGDAEPLPTAYARNFEEEKGAREIPARERRIAAVNLGAKTVTIAGFDWRREVVPGNRIKIDKSTGNNGVFTVGAVSWNGNDTVITLTSGVTSNATPLGSVFTLPTAVEQVMTNLDQAAAVAGIPKMQDLVQTFATDLAAISNNAGALASLRTKVNELAPKILRRARSLAQNDRAHADDFDRILYWTRLRLEVALKSHPFCLATISGRNELLNLFEQGSRGYGVNFASAPAGARKILVIAFDPFGLDSNLEAGNPSAAVALALAGRTLTAAGKNAFIETVILPVRYREMNAGRVEALVDPFLAGAGRVDLILTTSQGDSPRFDLARLASKRRGGGVTDNEFVAAVESRLGAATDPEFFETNLPVPVLVPGPFATPPAADQKLFFNQAYSAKDPASSEKHPQEGGPNSNAASYALASIAGKADEGSAGAFLANELFYRVARRRAALASTTLTGHLELPAKSAGGNTIDAVITEVESLIQRWLGSL